MLVRRAAVHHSRIRAVDRSGAGLRCIPAGDFRKYVWVCGRLRCGDCGVRLGVFVAAACFGGRSDWIDVPGSDGDFAAFGVAVLPT